MARKGSDVKISKYLSWILRHGALELGLNIREDGFVDLSEIFSLPQMHNVSFSDVEELVKNNNKKRFALRIEGEAVYIRANQGHSIDVVQEDSLLEKISDPLEVPVCVHGTYYEFWPSIFENGDKSLQRTKIQSNLILPFPQTRLFFCCIYILQGLTE